jgi:hypothetical protein
MPQHILDAHVRHPQKRRVERVSEHRIDGRIAPVSVTNGKRRRSHHVVGAACAAAVAAQGAPLSEPLPADATMQELREEDQLPFARHESIHIESSVIPPALRVHGLGSKRVFERPPLTLGVSPRRLAISVHAQLKEKLTQKTQPFNSLF